MSEDKKIIRELTDEEIEDVNGGMGLGNRQIKRDKCPVCGLPFDRETNSFPCGHLLVGQRGIK